MRLRDLERALGVRLIERKGSGSGITSNGEIILEIAVKVIEQVEALQDAASSLRLEFDRRLVVGASLTVAEYLMPTWMAELRRAAPTLTVSLRMGNSTQISDAVRLGELELGFLEGTKIPRDLEAQRVGTDVLRVAVDRSHPWTRRRAALSIDELCSTPILVRERGSGTREVLDEALSEHGRTVTILAEIASTTAIKAAVKGGLAPAVVSVLTVRDELQKGELVAVDVDGLDLTRAISVVTRGDRPRSRAAAIFLDLVFQSELAS
jgi:DNA-binding transcriptional LysR family regulator